MSFVIPPIALEVDARWQEEDEGAKLRRKHERAQTMAMAGRWVPLGGELPALRMDVYIAIPSEFGNWYFIGVAHRNTVICAHTQPKDWSWDWYQGQHGSNQPEALVFGSDKVAGWYCVPNPPEGM